MEPNRYQQGKIYKIVSPHTEKIYIGSTTKQYLSQRLAKHKSDFKEWLKHGKHNVTSYRLLELGDVEIMLLETYPCNSKDELHKKEREYIENFKDIVVNHVIPTRTKMEYDIIYYNNNLERISERSKQYYENNEDEIKQRVKEYRKNNIEKIKEYDRERHQQLYDCVCGKKQIKKGCKGSHNKTEKHQTYLMIQTL